ncbi:uncharacterized protein L3040_008560 [Drepanopeziza brunnea f. sp. 'multigermtubi']|uniref:uncharacterized protein n=1 Tax=Drepanopeziza brunnea f. sp. 'multigermtubi' TaxID=698441 RepID=UPI002395AD50|nr:hypothetical protein L3040_008560 [Drepanopeziza brunnea f. sp. 'multigermtubi']
MFEDNTLGCDVQLVQIHFTMIKGLDTLSEDPIINHQNRRAFALPTPAAATRGSREYLLNNLPCLQDFQASLGVDRWRCRLETPTTRFYRGVPLALFC